MSFGHERAFSHNLQIELLIAAEREPACRVEPRIEGFGQLDRLPGENGGRDRQDRCLCVNVSPGRPDRDAMRFERDRLDRRGETERGPRELIGAAILLTLSGWTSPRIAEAFGVRETRCGCGAARSRAAVSKR